MTFHDIVNENFVLFESDRDNYYKINGEVRDGANAQSEDISEIPQNKAETIVENKWTVSLSDDSVSSDLIEDLEGNIPDGDLPEI